MPAPLLTLSPEPVPVPPEADGGAWGAEITFLGRVRGTENGRPISGIEYTAYLPMALQCLERIAADLQKAHGEHPLRIHHRLGFVPTGEASILIAVGGRHSPETFALCAEYLKRIKSGVPVWKGIRYAD